MEGWRHEGNPARAQVPPKYECACTHGGDVSGQPSAPVALLSVAGPDMGCRWEDIKGPHQILHPQHIQFGPYIHIYILPCFAEALDTPNPKGKSSSCSNHPQRLKYTEVSSNLTWAKGSKIQHQRPCLCYSLVLTKLLSRANPGLGTVEGDGPEPHCGSEVSGGTLSRLPSWLVGGCQ